MIYLKNTGHLLIQMDMRGLAPSVEPKEEWYVHFFTVALEPDSLTVFWYKDTQVYHAFFEDVRAILDKMKEYGLCHSFSGDVLCVPHERVFVEKLVLLGVTLPSVSYDWKRLEGTSLSLEAGTCQLVSYFQDMMPLLFQEYDAWYSFSSTDPVQEVTVVSKTSAFVTPMTPITSISDAEKRLLYISFLGHTLLLAWVPLQITHYSVFESSLENSLLYQWFLTMVQKRHYALAKQQLGALDYYHTHHPDVMSIAVAVGDTMTQVTEVASLEETDTKNTLFYATPPASPTYWANLFCELYVEASAEHDTLLSEIYQDYLTVSGWSGRDKLLSMTAFVKFLRSLGRYTIKRRSKGLTLVGHRSLVSQQTVMYHAVQHGQGYERNLLTYRTLLEIQTILEQYDALLTTDAPYRREACLALHDRGLQLDESVLSSFCDVPHMMEELARYSIYLTKVLSQPLGLDRQAHFLAFRQLSEECVLYYPFVIRDSLARTINAMEELSDVRLEDQFHGLSLTGMEGDAEEIASLP